MPSTPIPITTEVIRHGLNSAAEAMKRALDPHGVLADHLRGARLRGRPLRPAHAPARAGAEPAVLHGHDELLHRGRRRGGRRRGRARARATSSSCNDPYGTGSHPQDAAVVMPVYLPDGELSATRRSRRTGSTSARKEIYCTDTTDVFQEGTIFPGVKLYRRGELVEDIQKMAIANSRLPKFVLGDINAEVAGVRAGASRACSPRRALRARGVLRLRRADVRPRRGRRAQLLREDAGRPLRRPRRRWTTTASRTRRSRSKSCSRSTGTTARLDFSQRAGAHVRAGQLPDRVDGVGGSRHHDDARGRRRGAERGPLPPDRGRSRGRARCSMRSRRRRASSTGGRRCRRSRRCSTRSPRRCRRRSARAPAATSAALVWYGVREETGEFWA